MNREVDKYVVGFMFNESMTEVALIRKNKPAWQTGLLNGIGGKVEGDEPALFAMIREFDEEAGCNHAGWINFCSMSGANNDNRAFHIEFFFCKNDPHRLTSMESEKIEIHCPKSIAAGEHKTIGNLPWLVALALDFGNGVWPPKKVVASY